ncbi:MAG: sulfurtransferase, partial [Halomonas sp.]|nr:sulfurtransferase [Halomonas sp.]
MSTQHSAHSVCRYIICLAWISGIFSGVAGAEVPAASFNQQGYRLPPFKAPVTAPLPGVTTLDDDTFQVLLESSSVILVDVYALTWHNGLFLQDTPHLTIPGSI